MFFSKLPGLLDSNNQLRIHKMMTDCLHYKDYARDAIKLVVEKLELSERERKWMVKRW